MFGFRKGVHMAYTNYDERVALESMQIQSNDAFIDSQYQAIYDRLRALYRKYGIDTNTNFAALKRKANPQDIETINKELSELRKNYDDSDITNQLQPIRKNGNQYDLISSILALGVIGAYYKLGNRISKQVDKGIKAESDRLRSYYKLDIPELHTNRLDRKNAYQPYLDNQSINALYEKKKRIRSDLIARRDLEKTLDQFQKQAKKEKGSIKSILINAMTDLQTDEQLDAIVLAKFDGYIIITEPSACSICKPFHHTVHYLSEYDKGINAPKFHPNCRCTISGYQMDKK